MSTYLEFDYITKNTFSSRSCANDNHSSRGDAKYKFRSRNNDKYRFTATAKYRNQKGYDNGLIRHKLQSCEHLLPLFGGICFQLSAAAAKLHKELTAGSFCLKIIFNICQAM